MNLDAIGSAITGTILTMCIAIFCTFAFFLGAGYGYVQKQREVLPPPYAHFHAICLEREGLLGIGWDARDYRYFGMCGNGHDYATDGTDMTPDKR